MDKLRRHAPSSPVAPARRWLTVSLLGAVARLTGLVTLGVLAGCSSSAKSGGTDAGEFGGTDSGAGGNKEGGTASHSSTNEKKDSGGKSTSSDAGAEKDGSCGTKPKLDWCMQNATPPMESSNLLCDDFDKGSASSEFQYIGLNPASWVSGAHVSPYCALAPVLSSPSATGSYTDHPYPSIPMIGSGSVAFDIRVPGGTACNGATVGRVWTSKNADVDSFLDVAATAWVQITDVAGTGATATSYTAQVVAEAGYAATDAGGPLSSPRTVTVTPDAQGWARIELDVKSYNISVNPAEVEALASWYIPGNPKVQGSTVAVSAGGTLPMASSLGAGMDVGLIPDPKTGVATAGCDILIDDVVSDISNP